MNDDILWQTKLAARVHDPAEKALVLLRDPAGHEGGTSRALTRLLGLSDPLGDNLDPDNAEALSTVVFKKGLPLSIYRNVQRADWWASAADRPQWPMESVTTPNGKTLAVAQGAQVRWTQSPVLIHPLTGEQFDLGKQGGLNDTDLADIKQRSFDHFSGILGHMKDAGLGEDPKRILLSYWRFGPELVEERDNGKLGALWRLLPADTRVPDHSIWDHLDLTSAFAGAFAGDPEGEAALLALSIGPVQGFIAAARTTSDLWAGSHLLSRLAWEAMKPVCEQLGPDAILFPRLRGVPQVDLWLRDELGLPDRLFADCEWTKGGTDSNPLFSAALPNRFVAVVPASRAAELAEEVSRSVRDWLQGLGKSVVDRLLEVAGLGTGSEQYCHQQMREQLEGFPEVHWAAVPFALIRPRDRARQTDLDVSGLSEAMAPFFGVEMGAPCGFLDSPAWRVLAEGIDWGDGTRFFAPNPGVLYPAVHDLAERVLAAAKAVRPFGQAKQEGWRCSLSGEAEWLTTDPAQLQRSYRRQTDTLWARVANRQRSWAKEGEHLSGLPAIKRLWPTLFAKEVEKALKEDLGRFVVSTHTMALAHQLDRWLKRGGMTAEGLAFSLEKYRLEAVALPRRLMRRHAGNRKALQDAKRMVGLLEVADSEEIGDGEAAEIRRLLRATLGQSGPRTEGTRLETYYALLLMDGDRMGAILAGDEQTAIPYADSFHPQVRRGFDEHTARHPSIRGYGNQRRPISPNRHLAISGALNDFSLSLVRHVVETEHLGRVIYAGGDDVLAMLPVADLLSAMDRLRLAYSGFDPHHENGVDTNGLTLNGGFAMLGGRLMRTMGRNATASCGAVIAHHQAPLGAVLRQLRAAERRAKNEGGRNAFSLTAVKRSGGSVQFTAKWDDLPLLADLRAFLADPAVSRRAVYHTLEWLNDRELPPPEGAGDMLRSLLAYQFDRQTESGEREGAREVKARVPGLAQRLAQGVVGKEGGAIPWLRNLLTVAEFLARETRVGGGE